MKTYFVLLAVLFLSTAATRLLQLLTVTDSLAAFKVLADIGLFALCLLGCYGLAFGKSFFSAAFWAWPGRKAAAISLPGQEVSRRECPPPPPLQLLQGPNISPSAPLSRPCSV